LSSPPTSEGARRRFRAESERWDAIYSEGGGWIARGWDRLTRSNVRRRFARTFAVAGELGGRTVLDLGCGSGRYLIEAAHRGAARVVGVDFAPEMIALARRLAAGAPRGEVISLECADVLAFDPGERFDLVVANGLFDYVADSARLLARAARLTRGLLVASFPDARAPRAVPRALYWRLRGVGVRLFSRAGIARLAERSGLEPLAIEKLGPIYLLVGSPPATGR